MITLTATITVPDNWKKEAVAGVISDALFHEAARRYREANNYPVFFSDIPTETFEGIRVDRIKYPNPPRFADGRPDPNNFAHPADYTRALREFEVSQQAASDQRTEVAAIAPVKENTKPIKLDRATRGQVRRVTNKLRTVEKKLYPSSSNPSRKYEAVIYQDGKVLCNCQGWTIKKGDKPRQCKHTKDLINNRPTRDDGEFIYLTKE